jgi:lysophospholipase L1-like esterase
VRSVVASILLAVGSVVFVLLAGEAVCRIAGYRSLETYRPDSELGWVLEPGQQTVTRVGHLPVRINGDGYRDDPLEHPKPPGTIRIFALGGSTTFGWGVAQTDIYHQVLERMLNDSARAAGSRARFEIVNGGVIGYNLWQVAHAVARIAGQHQPDGFLLDYTFNDAWNNVGRMSEAQRSAMLAGVRRKNLMRRSALFNWLIDARARKMADQAGHGAGEGLANAQTADTSTSVADLAAYQAILDSIVSLARRDRLSLSFTVLAARGQDRSWPRQATMLEVARDAHVPALDLLPIFKAAPPDSAYLPHDAVHPSALGHSMIARRVYTLLCTAAAAARAGDPARVYLPGCGTGHDPHNPAL